VAVKRRLGYLPLPDDIDYRGPSKPLREIGNEEPIVADRIGNHGSGGHVLRLDSSVDEIPKLIDRASDGDALWSAAAASLKD